MPGLVAKVPDHFMSDFFRAQLYLDLHLWDSAASVLDGKLQHLFSNSPFTISQQAFCLYSRQRTWATPWPRPPLCVASPSALHALAPPGYDEADAMYTDLLQREPKRLEQVDVLSNMLYVRENAERLSQLAHHVLDVDRFRPETCCVIGTVGQESAQGGGGGGGI